MKKVNLFMIGGAKGVGKTSLTSEIAFLLNIHRIESGKIVFDYVSKNLPLDGLTSYITREILLHNFDLILDTHYARYSDREEPNKQFQLGLEPENLEMLTKQFDVFPCLLEVPVIELGARRIKDRKSRIISSFYTSQELKFNRKGYKIYLKELNQEPFILSNKDYTTTKNSLIEWILKIRDKK